MMLTSTLSLFHCSIGPSQTVTVADAVDDDDDDADDADDAHHVVFLLYQQWQRVLSSIVIDIQPLEPVQTH